MGTHPIFESDFDCLTDVEMGLYDDDDNVVAKVGGGWSAAANQAVSFRAEQQRKRQEESQARDRQKQKEQQAKQQLKANAFTAFMPNRISETPNIRKLPNLSRPTKIVCLQNMVSANEVDSDLPDEVSSECSKFGQVVKVRI